MTTQCKGPNQSHKKHSCLDDNRPYIFLFDYFVDNERRWCNLHNRVLKGEISFFLYSFISRYNEHWNFSLGPPQGSKLLAFIFIHFRSFSNIHSLVNEWTFIHYYTVLSSCKLSSSILFTYTFPFLKMQVCKMNEKFNNVWMSIRSLVSEYLKMNGNVWK